MKQNVYSYPPLAEVTQEVFDTNQAAFYASLSPKTLRAWASSGSGPIVPDFKIRRRNRYKVSRIREYLSRGGAE
jgi:hypothetical protein